MALNLADTVQKLGFAPGVQPVLWVALVTWSGVFFYLLRLERLARALEEAETRTEAR